MKYDVGIGAHDEFPPGSSDCHVFGIKLKEGNSFPHSRIDKTLMNFGRNMKQPDGEVFSVFGPVKHFDERLILRNGIIINNEQLGGQPVFFCEAGKPVHGVLEPVVEITAVIVVSSDQHNTQIWRSHIQGSSAVDNPVQRNRNIINCRKCSLQFAKLTITCACWQHTWRLEFRS
jgi:hypothetical protein